jgi:hypothetical protein
VSGLREVPGVPESALTRSETALLPVSTPGPPWRTKVRAVMWVHRAAPGAAGVLDGETGPTIPLTIAALVEYLESPVGPYSEVFASPVLLRGVVPSLRVPFIAVDSIASVHGGRAHWSLPKALAEFTWDGERTGVAGTGWTVDVNAHARGPRLPLVGGLRVAQPRWSGGVPGPAWVRLAGRARYATVTVGCSGPTLPQWLLAGKHRGVVIDNARMTVRPPSA